MAYDAARRETLLFGGRTMSSDGIIYPDELWAWNGERWRRLEAPANTARPRGRDVPHMAYDVARSRVVVSGGRRETGSNTEILTDTWEWDGTAWHQVVGADAPAVLHATLSYSHDLRQLLLYGGVELEPSIRASRKLYAFDGTRWVTRDSSGPPDEFPGASVSVPGQGLILMSRKPGSDNDPVPTTSTISLWQGRGWETKEAGPGYSNLQATTSAGDGTLYFYQSWDRWLTAPLLHVRTPPGSWQTISPPTNPGIRQTLAMAYDESRQRLVLYGGRNSNAFLSDTWEFDGRTWERRN